MRPTNIIIHHSLTKDSGTVSLSAIRRYHKAYVYQGKIITKDVAELLMSQGKYVKKPWRDIGYQVVVELVNDEYEIIMGRMPNESGAHCREQDMNFKSIGICCVGNFDTQPPPKALLNKLRAICLYFMAVYGIPPENVYGHREFASYKSCPGNMFDMEAFRKSLVKEV